MTNTQTICTAETDHLKSIIFQWFSEAEIEKAKNSGKKCCKVCRCDGVPGFVINALQWVQCWGCGK